MIAVENLSKSYGSRCLFDRITFKINPKERVGLVGRNGHGKSTLFKILLGREDYDDGALFVPKYYRMGHVSQRLDFTEDSVLKEAMRRLPANERDHHWKVEKALAGLGFSNRQMERPPGRLSGGFQVRLNLAKTLVSEPDLLLLDEPTNYLDITAIRWVRRFLAAWPRELILITHDRSFMDAVVTHTMGIHRKKIRKIAGDTGKYYAQVARDEEVYEKARIKDARRRQEMERFIARFRAKARLAGLVQSRIKTLSKIEKKERLEKLRNLEFAFTHRPFKGKQLLRVNDLTFGYPGQGPLIQELDFSLHPKDRIGVIGPNGKGKTTLLKLLAGVLTPDSGTIAYHSDAAVGFYEQTNIEHLRNSLTVLEEIQAAVENGGLQKARDICGAMLFEGDDALKKVGVLSGGEKARVLLGKILAAPANLLLLDEPTNHLDMESADALLEAMDAFEGAVILVTHNEMFLHALANRLVVFLEDRIVFYEGTYQEFLEAGGWDEEGAAPPARSGSGAGSGEGVHPGKRNKKSLRKMRSKIIAERSRHLRPLVQRIDETEASIENLERRLEETQAALIAASQEQRSRRIAELSTASKGFQQEIERQFHVLERLYLQKETLEAEYGEKLESLGHA